MSTAVEIIEAILKRSPQEAADLREWAGNWIEDDLEMRSDFLAQIEEVRADIAAERVRIRQPQGEILLNT